MPTWLNIGGIFGNFGSVFDLGYRFTSRKAIQEKDATVLLDEINKILLMTTDTLELYKDLLPPADYATFKAEHRALQLKLQEESAHQLNFKDALIQHGRVPSSTKESRESVRVRAAYLLEETEVYQSRVITASRRARTFDPPSFPDEPPVQTSPLPTQLVQPAPSPSGSQAEPTQPSPSELSPATSTGAAPIAKLIRSSVLRSTAILTSSTRTAAASSTSSFDTLSTNNNRYALFEDDDLLIAVTHIRDEGVNDSSPSGASSKNWYRRVLSVRDGDEVIDVVDPQLYELTDDQVSVDERVMRVLHQATERWMAKKLANDID
ncbi:hypothetical protein RhiJN_15102 [Ceratobasidium sp. AG-Ba]|nr:hypothetical protein RhiJN_15102 [Ceratobasidium sp. AG-Ba]